MLDEILGSVIGEFILIPIGKVIGFILKSIGASILYLLRFGTRPYQQFLKEDVYGLIPHTIGFVFLFASYILFMIYRN